MAVRTAQALSDDSYHATVFLWAGLLLGDTGSVVAFPKRRDRCVQFAGVFGTATIALHGSMNGVDFIILTDPQGNAISKTAAAIEVVSEAVLYLKPVISGGDGTTAIDVYLGTVEGVYS